MSEATLKRTRKLRRSNTPESRAWWAKIDEAARDVPKLDAPKRPRARKEPK